MRGIARLPPRKVVLSSRAHLRRVGIRTLDTRKGVTRTAFQKLRKLRHVIRNRTRLNEKGAHSIAMHGLPAMPNETYLASVCAAEEGSSKARQHGERKRAQDGSAFC